LLSIVFTFLRCRLRVVLFVRSTVVPPFCTLQARYYRIAPGLLFAAKGPLRTVVSGKAELPFRPGAFFIRRSVGHRVRLFVDQAPHY